MMYDMYTYIVQQGQPGYKGSEKNTWSYMKRKSQKQCHGSYGTALMHFADTN